MNAILLPDTAQPVRLTLTDFELLHRSGAFEGQSKVELIEGVLLRMNPQQRRHSYAKTQLAVRLDKQLSAIESALAVIIEGTVAMPPSNAPEPDIVLTDAPRGDGYIPLESVALVVEVSDSSVAFDLKEKAALYASQGVPEYWVLEIPGAMLHQFWAPSEIGYREARSIRLGERIESITIAGLAVESDGLI